MQILRCRRNIKKLKIFRDDTDIDLWALDEVRFEQHGTCCRMWVPPEIKEPFVLHHPTRKSVGYFGAVRLRDGKFVYRREDDKFNGTTFFSFLKQLRRVSARSGRKAVVIIDNVRYHHARLHAVWREKSKEKFALEFMPPYSPELNPIERIWKLTRRKGTHNRYFSSLKGIIEAVEVIFKSWRHESDVLRRLCAIN